MASVWGIASGSEARPIDATIAATRAFFASIDIPTRLSAYQLGQAAVEAVLGKFGALGDRAEVDLAASRRILEAAQ